jgi:hypothetical protein
MKVFFSEPEVEEILSLAMIRISCSADGECNHEKLLKALTRQINKAIDPANRGNAKCDTHQEG